jgi:alanine racemase
MSRTALATIHLGALRQNFARVRALAGKARVMAVVKADAYGHGLERVARTLSAADAFGVASIGDGLRLRACGIASRIVVLSGPDDAADLPEFRRLELEPVIHHGSQLAWLEADRDPRPLRVWLKIDTGMHRLGFDPAETAVAYARLRALDNIARDIVLMTHFAASDAFDSPRTEEQIRTFVESSQGLSGARSLANSAALLGFPAAHGDWVRVGGALYGLSVIPGRSGAELGFAPAMTLSTKLISIKQVPRGAAIGYGNGFVCPQAMPIGVAAIGYGDGYPRAVPNGTPVLIHGVRAPIVGRVSMDLITIDLRSVPQAQVGDRVVLWGPQLPVEEIADRAGTIGYELTCGITRRVLCVEDDH